MVIANLRETDSAKRMQALGWEAHLSPGLTFSRTRTLAKWPLARQSDKDLHLAHSTLAQTLPL